MVLRIISIVFLVGFVQAANAGICGDELEGLSKSNVISISDFKRIKSRNVPENTKTLKKRNASKDIRFSSDPFGNIGVASHEITTPTSIPSDSILSLQRKEYKLLSLPSGIYRVRSLQSILYAHFSREIVTMAEPVSQELWVSIMGENPSEFLENEPTTIVSFRNKIIKVQKNIPVNNVTWWSAVEFANRLSLAEGLPPVYDLSAAKFVQGTRAEDGSLQVVLDGSDFGRINSPDGKTSTSEGFYLPTSYQSEAIISLLASKVYTQLGLRFIDSKERFFHEWNQNAKGRMHDKPYGGSGESDSESWLPLGMNNVRYLSEPSHSMQIEGTPYVTTTRTQVSPNGRSRFYGFRLVRNLDAER